MKDLIAAINAHGVNVFATGLPADTLGCFIPELRRVYYDTRLTPHEERVVLAHELGHVTYGHSCLGPGRSSSKRAEHQADVFAARYLIDPATYERLELINPDPHAIADELHVTVELVEFYRDHCLTALDGITYALPREGLGQWHHRALREGVA